MIVTKAPLRFSMGGGGTDLPSYYKEHEGFLVAAAINKYVFVNLHVPFDNKIYVSHRHGREEVDLANGEKIDKIQHPTYSHAIKLLHMEQTPIELTSVADMPYGTGLGSSGTFLCALLKALHTHQGNDVSPKELAEQVCHIIIDVVGDPEGKQDPYAAAHGGFNSYTFHRDGSVHVEKVKIPEEAYYNLQSNLLLFYTGMKKSSSETLNDQKTKSERKDPAMIDNLNITKDLGYKSRKALEAGDVDEFGRLMHVHWENKKQRSNGITNPIIDKHYQLARENGALGGKIIGAGGRGCWIFYTNEPAKLRKAMLREGLKEIHYAFEPQGASVVLRT